MAKLERLITPSGVKTISENGEYDVASYEGVDVDVEVKARVEGTTLVIPKSTTAAPSMSAKFIERVYPSEGRNHYILSKPLENKLYYCYFMDMEGIDQTFLITNRTGQLIHIKVVETSNDDYVDGFAVYGSVDAINYSIDIICDTHEMYFDEGNYIDIYELPITLPTIEGE